MAGEYRDKVAVITGAANGLGRALARELAARHSRWALVDVDSAALETAKHDLVRHGTIVTHHCADVASESSLDRVAREVESAHGTVDFLINNAAVSASASFLNTSSTEFERVIQVNFFGLVYGCRAFLPLFRRAISWSNSQRCELFRMARISSQDGICVIERSGGCVLGIAEI